LWDAGHQAALPRLLADQCHLELLLLPLRSGRRMLGAVAPLAILAWLGTSRLEPPHSAACAIFWKR